MEVDKITHTIIGCAMKVHNTLKNGFQEVIYQRALAIEFEKSGLSFVREMQMPIHYLEFKIGERRVDFFVENLIMVELKAVSVLENVHKSQAINYLEAFRVNDGLLINFGISKLEFYRLYNSKLSGKTLSWKPEHDV
jgi:GxxExxY protein